MRKVTLNSFAAIDNPEIIELRITKKYGIKNSYPVEFVEVNVPRSSPSGKSEVWILI
jgi:hypothetical protein